MSVYLHRVIEAKDKDGNWELLKWYTPFKKRWDGDEPDIKIKNPCPLNNHNMVFDNACVYRELLNENDDLSERGKPSDCSDDTKKILKEYDEWSWGWTYITLSELCSWAEKEKTKLIRNITIEYNNHQFKKVNDKLDCLLNNKKYEAKPFKSVVDNSDGLDENGNDSMLSYYMTEGIDEYLSILYEAHWVSFASTELSSDWCLPENVRIIYFYS